MPTEAYSSPILYQANASKKWLRNEHDEWFSLANLGSYNQRLINQILSVADSLSGTLHFFPFLLNSSYESASFPTLYAENAPYCTVSEPDPYAYTPSAAEQQIVHDMLAFIREHQVVPLVSARVIIKMCKHTLLEVANRYEAEVDGPVERDKYNQIVWDHTCLAATCLGITEDSANLWDAVDLLERSINVYAKDKGLAGDLLD